MKKLLTLFVLSIGIFALAGVVSASTAEDLQPAATTYIDDELQVLGTARAYSVRIGAQGYGGVTFFNGTIINETTDVDSGAEMPVTFGDDVRIDGRIWRGENPGAGLDDNRELIVNDDMEVAGNLNVGNLVGTGVVNSANIEDGTITGSDISSSADLSVDSITTTGNIIQSRTKFGAIKAQVLVQEDGNCTTHTGYNWTYNNSTISCAYTDTGEYTLTFEFDAADRLATATYMGTSDKVVSIMPSTTNNRQYMVYAYNISTANPDTANFSFVLY